MMNIDTVRALIKSVKNAKTTDASELKKLGIDINAQNAKGYSALMYSVAHGNEEFAFDLINMGADIDHRDASGHSVLHMALIFQRKYITTVLLERGAKIDTVDVSGIMPLMTALYSDDPRIALELVAYGATKPDPTEAAEVVKKFKDRRHFKLAKLAALSMHQGAAQGGHTQRLKVLFNDFPSSARSDQPQALLKLALKHKRDDCAAFLQSLLASQAIEKVLHPTLACG